MYRKISFVLASGEAVKVLTLWTEILVPRVKVWIMGLGSISIRADKVLALAQPDRPGSDRSKTPARSVGVGVLLGVHPSVWTVISVTSAVAMTLFSTAYLTGGVRHSTL